MAKDKETFYFSHDYNAREDEKIRELIFQNGMVGYGIYWAIVEMLYQNANVLRTNYSRIAFDLHQSTNVIVQSVIEDFGLFNFSDDGEFFYSNSIQRRLEKRDEKSKKARESALNRWGKSEVNANASKTQYETNAIKESKVKDNKVNNILFTKESKLREVWEIFRGKRNSFEKDFKAFEKKTEGIEIDFEKLKREAAKCTNVYFQTWLNDFVPKSSGTGGEKKFTKEDFLKKLIELGADEKDAKVWMEVRKQKRSVFTEYVIDLIFEECERHNIDFSEAIKYSAKYSWQGFEYEWYLNKKNKENGTHNNTKQSNSYSGNTTGSSFKNSGKISARTVLARRLAEANQSTFSNSDGGDFTVDAEIIN